MKKTILLLGLSLLLMACVPTSDHEFVVNKGDDTVEQMLNDTPAPETDAHDPDAPTAALQRFPDRWDADVAAENDRVTLSVHTDVRTRADGLYPVYRTRAAAVTKDTAEDLAIRLLDRPRDVSEAVLTKADWTKLFRQYLNDRDRYEQWVAAGYPKDWPDIVEGDYSPEAVERESNWYMEQIEAAPDSLSSHAVNDYSGLRKGEKQSFTLASGDCACIVFDRGVSIAKHCKNWGYLYTVWQYREDLEWEEGSCKLWKEPTITREEAEAAALQTLDALGLSGFGVAGACEATLLDIEGSARRSIAGGWSLILMRDFGGYPHLPSLVHSSQSLQYGDGDGFAVNAYIEEERIELFVSDDGVDVLNWSGPRDVVGLVNANVRLLPFDRIQSRIADALMTCFPYEYYKDRAADAPRIELEIYDLMLSTVTVRAKDSDDYYEMPCWVVSFDRNDPLRNERDLMHSLREQELNNPICGHDCLIINAVDGSIVHTDYGI